MARRRSSILIGLTLLALSAAAPASGESELVGAEGQLPEHLRLQREKRFCRKKRNASIEVCLTSTNGRCKWDSGTQTCQSVLVEPPTAERDPWLEEVEACEPLDTRTACDQEFIGGRKRCKWRRRTCIPRAQIPTPAPTTLNELVNDELGYCTQFANRVHCRRTRTEDGERRCDWRRKTCVPEVLERARPPTDPATPPPAAEPEPPAVDPVDEAEAAFCGALGAERRCKRERFPASAPERAGELRCRWSGRTIPRCTPRQ